MDELRVVAERADGSTVAFPVAAQVGTPAAVDHIKHGGYCGPCSVSVFDDVAAGGVKQLTSNCP
jgi:hypothetical protein